MKQGEVGLYPRDQAAHEDEVLGRRVGNASRVQDLAAIPGETALWFDSARNIAERCGGCENDTMLNAVAFDGRSTWRERSFSAWVALSRSLPPIRGKVRLGLALYRALRLGASGGKASSTLFEERLLFHLNLGSLHERMALLMNGYEDETTSMLADLYSGGAILDIGANIGLVGLPLAVRTRARASKTPHLHAIEGLPSNYAVLGQSIAANALDACIQAHNVLLGARAVCVSIEIEGGDFDRTGTANVLPAAASARGRTLWTAPLDQWLRGVDAGRVDLIKLDTDGFDFEILKGAEGTLRRDQPLVFAELEKTCLGWHGQTASDVAAFVAACGYETWVLQPGRPPRFRSLAAAGPAQRDYLLVPQGRVAGLSWLLA